MGRRLKKRESIETGLRRLATREVRAALAALDHHRGGPSEGVHRARVACKRIRAWIMLVESGLDNARDEAAIFRLAASSTSQQRDAVVIRVALADLAGDCPQLASPAAWADGQLTAMLSGAVEAGQPAMHAALVDALARVAAWRVEGDGETIIRQGVERSYAAARSAFAMWTQDRSIEHLHAWRKAAKRLMFQLDILKGIGPKNARRTARRLRKLGEVLGGHRDLELVKQAVQTMPDDSRRGVLLDAIASAQNHLSAKADRRGRRLFGEKRRRFARRALPRRAKLGTA